MTVEDRLSKEQKQQLRNKRKKKEQLSFKDWQDIMNMNMPTYKRVHGKIKRR